MLAATRPHRKRKRTIASAGTPSRRHSRASRTRGDTGFARCAGAEAPAGGGGASGVTRALAGTEDTATLHGLSAFEADGELLEIRIGLAPVVLDAIDEVPGRRAIAVAV